MNNGRRSLLDATQYTHQTTSYDVATTIMKDELKCMNAISDFSVGASLWKKNPRDWFISGSYLESAIVESSRIVLFNELGMIKFKDRHYNKSKDAKRSKNLMYAIEDMCRFK